MPTELTAFDKFFARATGKSTPYDYQIRLACGEREDRDLAAWMACTSSCQSQLISIPTGLGKTAAVVLAWIWNRVYRQRPDWPRRLVYCLPMRTLVEQTEAEVQKWLRSHGLIWDGSGVSREGKVGVHILMGGEEAGEWDIYPEENAILIGTQDMLLSRALNRGYGMSRYRWPMHFGLLNNDCLWVMDETQLMGVGVETSAQLDGFRHDRRMPTIALCPTWWMSATLDDSRFATVDHPKPVAGWLKQTLSEAEKSSGKPRDLCSARKNLSPTALVLSSVTKGSYAKELATIIKQRHQPGTLTLVVVNRVSRAQEIYNALTDNRNPLQNTARTALVHSRFRKRDRKKHEEFLFGDGDRIVIATQAVEAGVDVSARLLITELAPWSSLVQRMGRCNRRADIPDAEILWVDIQPKDDEDDLLRPYSLVEITQARTAIAPLADGSLQALRDVVVPEANVIRPVLRRRDLIDLFDTTPDLCGQDLDISRYIRDGDDNDVQLFWRDIAGDTPTDEDPPPHRDELCRVSIGDARKFLGKKLRAWLWNPLTGHWEPAAEAYPGRSYLVDAKSGGYSDLSGWTGNPKNKPTPCQLEATIQETYADNCSSFHLAWQTLAEHSSVVVREMETLAIKLGLPETFAAVLCTAALWHDVGKAHEEFQAMLLGSDDSRSGTIWAKSGTMRGRCYRKGFRHELASALAWLTSCPQNSPDRDLVSYLIAAHHGKVRLSIRSMPNESGPQGDDRLFARGVWQGDTLPAISGLTNGPTILDLSYMKMGEGNHGPSWLARTISLRDRLGPFQLAYLETLLRVADARASSKNSID